MVRSQLLSILEFRGTFTGKYVRHGSKKGNASKITILLKDIYNDTVNVDHVWFNRTGGFMKLGHLKSGDIIQFDARVKKYIKGSGKRNIPVITDYKFNYPTNVKLIKL